METIKTGGPDGFKVPSTIPQDLLLIHDMVGADLPHTSSSSQNQAAETNSSSETGTTKPEDDADSIASSSSGDSLDEEGDVDMLKVGVPAKEEVGKGAESEEEVEAGLLHATEGGDPMTMPDSSPENSDSSSSGSDSDSDDSSVIEEFNPTKLRELLDSVEDEDDEGGGPGGRLVTAHEVLNEDVVVPEITEVDPKETLERVGEILSVLQDRIVIVKGITSQIVGHAPDRVLDTETLLVFEDRKVLGYIHETFGPTYQPLYQVQFNNKFPLDKERAQVSRPIFHVPGRSNFVFVERLKLAKGSDASNAHDEEPGEDEVEFSDDEREAAYKRMLKESRRSGSRASSRAPTPGASVRRDFDHFDDTFRESNNPYGEHGAYDMDYGAGPSRPAPIPYDDPYSDSFTSVTDGDGEDRGLFDSIRNVTGGHDPIRAGSIGSIGSNDGSGRSAHANDRNLDPGARHHNTRGRGRGGGGRNRQADRGRRGRGRGAPQRPPRPSPHTQRSGPQDHPSMSSPTDFGPRDHPGMTPPTSFGHPYSQQQSYGGVAGEWSYGAPLMTPQQPVFGFGLQNALSGVQPHINPRFANQLGFNLSQVPQIPQMSPGVGSPPPSEQYHPGDANLGSTTGRQWEEGSG